MEVDQLNPNARTQVLKDCLQQGLIQINGLSGHFAFVPQIHLRWTNVWMDMVQLFPQIKQIILIVIEIYGLCQRAILNCMALRRTSAEPSHASATDVDMAPRN